jgi:diacylglycerol kinase family enzyme
MERRSLLKCSTCLIFNPIARQGNPEKDLALIESLLQPAVTLEVVITTAKTDIGQLAKAAIDRGVDSIIASGGDGTLVHPFHDYPAA